MRAWVVNPLRLVEKEVPEPGPAEVRVRVSVCGVCRTDLHLAEGDLPPKRQAVVPGHEAVGFIDAVGNGVTTLEVGDRVGIPWLRSTCGSCRFCLRGDENLCEVARFTGWDSDGGYAEYAVIDENYAYRLPAEFDDEHAAPLLCSGIIGYRALRQSNLPPGGKLGIYGFGGSAHIAIQVAVFEGASVYVVTRSERGRSMALGMGATWAGNEAPNEPLDAAILFAPVGELVPTALRALDRGATLAVAGIHLTSIPPLDYSKDLFFERKLVSVTANTRKDGRDFLELAAKVHVEVSTSSYDFQDAPAALKAMGEGRLSGAAVLRMGREGG